MSAGYWRMLNKYLLNEFSDLEMEVMSLFCCLFIDIPSHASWNTSTRVFVSPKLYYHQKFLIGNARNSLISRILWSNDSNYCFLKEKAEALFQFFVGHIPFIRKKNQTLWRAELPFPLAFLLFTWKGGWCSDVVLQKLFGTLFSSSLCLTANGCI